MQSKKGCRVLVLPFLAAAVLLGGCASHPKMQNGAPLEVRRGYWVQQTTFYQRDRELDRGHVKETLATYEEAQGASQRGELFELFSRVTAGVGGICLGWGLAGKASVVELRDDTALTLILAGSGAVGLSVGLAIAADGSYVSAVGEYNAVVGASSLSEDD